MSSHVIHIPSLPQAPEVGTLRGKIRRADYQCFLAIFSGFAMLLYIMLGALIYNFDSPKSSFGGTHTKSNLIDGMYFSVVTLATVGYGDLSPLTLGTKMLCVVLSLLGTVFNSLLFLWVTFLYGKMVNNKIKWKWLVLGSVMLVGFIGICCCEVTGYIFLKAFYLTLISVISIGYGDESIKSLAGRTFAIIWLIVAPRVVIQSSDALHEFLSENLLRRFFKWIIRENVEFPEISVSVEPLPNYPTFKIVIIGDAATGKTALLKINETGEFKKKYFPTLDSNVVQLDFFTKSGKVRFDCWDIGEDAYYMGEDAYYMGAHGAIIMWDATSKKTYNNVERWYNDVYRACGDIPMVLCRNKADVKCRVKNKNPRFYMNKTNVQFYETSVKTMRNIEKPFLHLARKLTDDQTLQFIDAPIRQLQRVRVDLVRSSGTMPFDAYRQSLPP